MKTLLALFAAVALFVAAPEVQAHGGVAVVGGNQVFVTNGFAVQSVPFYHQQVFVQRAFVPQAVVVQRAPVNVQVQGAFGRSVNVQSFGGTNVNVSRGFGFFRPRGLNVRVR